jgi:hypothetical protein
VAGWEGLRAELRRLFVESPGAVVAGPNPYSERRRSEKRVLIELAAWATDIAASLHATYGGFVDLLVGAMTYPAGELWARGYSPQLPGEPTDEFVVEPLGPLSVRSGRFVRADLMVTNRAAYPQVLITNGDLTSAVTDRSGGVVGMYVGPRYPRRVGFPIEPGQSSRIPVLIGAASVVPELGYAVPPGQWGLLISLHPENGSWLLASLGLTVTP